MIVLPSYYLLERENYSIRFKNCLVFRKKLDESLKNTEICRNNYCASFFNAQAALAPNKRIYFMRG